ncbi:MAG: CDP-archaeol synthase [Anaerolineales bacterium]|nr:CDP-archaeol synthase [Anaerolineales bacterium]
MLRQRVVIAILLVPLILWVIVDGGWFFAGAIALALAIASVEFGQLFKQNGLRPAIPLLGISVFILTFGRFLGEFNLSGFVLTLFCLTAMTWHLIDYERGAPKSGTDFVITLAGITYVGWIGPHLISLRALPDGQWWILIAMPAVWLADSAAYFVGKWIGRNPLAPKLSPKKSWEGYIAGVVIGSLAGIVFAAIWRIAAGDQSTITILRGFLLGLIVSIIAPLGDLGVSMLKREMNVKDSGSIIPGHGGFLDRIDSWIWASVLGYYLVLWFIQ